MYHVKRLRNVKYVFYENEAKFHFPVKTNSIFWVTIGCNRKT